MTGAHFNGGRGYDHSSEPRTGDRYDDTTKSGEPS